MAKYGYAEQIFSAELFRTTVGVASTCPITPANRKMTTIYSQNLFILSSKMLLTPFALQSYNFSFYYANMICKIAKNSAK